MDNKPTIKQYAVKATEAESKEEVKPFESDDLSELTGLMSVRQYVVNATANPTMDRAAVNYLNGSLIMIDKKIMSILQGDSFKLYINYADVRKAIEEVAKITNIKSSFNKKV